MSNKKGKFIVVEGGDFSGKSTFINKIKKEYPNFKYTREPGNLLDTTNSKSCEEIRNTVLTHKMSYSEQAWLFAKSREMHTKDIIELINKGYNVICDRYILSSFAYQGHAGELGFYNVYKENQYTLNLLRLHNIQVHVLLFQVNEDTYQERKNKRKMSDGLDVIEQQDEQYFKKVNDFFNTDIYMNYVPITTIFNLYLIDANKTIDEVFEEGKQTIEKIINN